MRSLPLLHSWICGHAGGHEIRKERVLHAARSTLRPADSSTSSLVRVRSDRRPGTRHQRHHRRLFGATRCADRPASLSRSGATGSVPRGPARHRADASADQSRVRHAARADGSLRVGRGCRSGTRQSHCARRHGAGERGRSQRKLPRHARRGARAWPRRPAGRQPRAHQHQLRGLAAVLQRQSRHRRRRDRSQRPSEGGRGRAAARVHGLSRQRRLPVAADGPPVPSDRRATTATRFAGTW